MDGAHTAGQLPLPADRPGQFVCLTLHKWLHLPKGTGFLVVPEDAADDLRPVVTSWYADSGTLPPRFAWAGTDDVVAHLVAREAVAYQRSLLEDGLHDHRAKLTTHAQDLLLSVPGVRPLPPAPRSPAMVSVALPPCDPEGLLRRLHARDVDLWCGATEEGGVLRLSVAPYTTPEDVDHGVSVLEEVLAAVA